MQLDHIGWITDNVEKFESFWCDILGYKICHSSEVSEELCQRLFGVKERAIIKRYKKENSPTIEIHSFFGGSVQSEKKFHQSGINHICFYTGERGSKGIFLESLPKSVNRLIYINPGGWINVFIQDFEDNWIELREGQ